ncbi:MAG: hypothetical protein COV66_12875 [Nitrospinae bacterium CG11_big_fil_rev_8_21_14_0_20_45_15]|nr:MAG: hypothetical protein COV66_12875 [Nitrospinae bacterium CG11_big_fil_rev_8_21_14_0_20_45_15]
MKMHHLSEEDVSAVMGKVKEIVAESTLDPEKIKEAFLLSKVAPDRFLECKANPLQTEKVNFELDEKKGIRFFDPFNFFTKGIYKDMDGLTIWTADNLKEPWSYDEE